MEELVKYISEEYMEKVHRYENNLSEDLKKTDLDVDSKEEFYDYMVKHEYMLAAIDSLGEKINELNNKCETLNKEAENLDNLGKLDAADKCSSLDIEIEKLTKLRNDLIKKCKSMRLKVSRIDKLINKRIKVMDKKRNKEATRFIKK